MIPKALMHCIAYHLGVQNAETQLSDNERKAIAELARNAQLILEIGVFEGSTTRILIENSSRCSMIYGVDPFFRGRLGICYSKSIAMKEARRGKTSNERANYQFFECLSSEATNKINGDMDFIFIDGDHSLDGIAQDWSDWASRVKVGGIIALHDTVVPSYNPNVANLGSCKYFDSDIRHDQRFLVEQQIDSMSVLRRLF